MGLEKLSELRKQKGLTIDELARQSNVPKGTITKIFAGETQDPKLNTLKALCKVLGCTINDLVEPTESEKEKSPPPAEADDELTQKIASDLYETLIRAGWCKPGEDITDQQRDILLAVIDILDATFRQT